MYAEDLRTGQTFGPGAWRQVTQADIDAFAAATGDHQWLHTDPARAAEGPFGTTIAHGWLSLSLVAPFIFDLLSLDDALVVNYGANRVRFPSPLPCGDRIRATFRVDEVTSIDKQATQLVLDAVVEREHGAKPVCAAQLVMRTQRA